MDLHLSVERRGLLSGLVGLLFTVLPGRAAAQLLDPSVITRRASSNYPDSPLVANGPGPSYARSMAQSIVGALGRLVSAFASTSNRLTDLTEREKKLAAELDQKILNKEKDLEEYRQGLFCSGCGKTRSQILSEGSQFPHPGQTIIKATPEQIAARERQLDDAIARVRDNLDRVRKDKSPLDGDLTRIRNEIFNGGLLWYTAVTYEDALVTQRDVDSAHRYVERRKPITELVERLTKSEPDIVDPDQRRQAESELGAAGHGLEAAESKRKVDLRAYQLAIASAQRSARNDSDRFRSMAQSAAAGIKDSANRGYLEININLLSKASSIQWADGGGRGTGGIFFHMGEYSEEGTRGTRPEVQTLIERAGQPFRVGPGPYYPSFDEESASVQRLLAKLRVVPAAQVGE